MKILSHKIPSSFIHKKTIKQSAQLVAPPGVNIDKLSLIVANQIASTVIHEAAHGERWAQEYLTGKLKLNEMSRTEEESIAEKAEQNSGLSTDLNQDIFDDSENTDTLSEEMLLDKAITVANANNTFYIPRDSVQNAKLSNAWGQFEMVQGPDLEISEDTTVAWDHNNRKLLVDVSSIINEYNRAMSLSNSQQQNQDYSTPISEKHPENTPQSSGPDTSFSPTTSVPSVQGIPSR